jgi:hypothetical protein
VLGSVLGSVLVDEIEGLGLAVVPPPAQAKSEKARIDTNKNTRVFFILYLPNFVI